MISSLRGTLGSIGPNEAILEVGGVGYQVLMPTRSLETLGPPGAEIFVRTHLVVREDELTLYGFMSAEDLKIFGLLIEVNGVGPRQALRLLSVWDGGEIASAITTDDAEAISKAPGIGKKIAGRIILELKPTLEKEWAGSLPSGAATVVGNDAIAALLQLGYTRAEAQAALSSVDHLPSLSLEEQVSAALQRLGG